MFTQMLKIRWFILPVLHLSHQIQDFPWVHGFPEKENQLDIKIAEKKKVMNTISKAGNPDELMVTVCKIKLKRWRLYNWVDDIVKRKMYDYGKLSVSRFAWARKIT